ncbi:hypothetical protein [Streptomyces sp. NPDC057702]
MASVAVASAFIATGAGEATAAPRAGCLNAVDRQGVELYFNSNPNSASQGFTDNQPTFADDYFMCRGNGNGYTQVVKNNAAYVTNWNSHNRYRIYYNTNYDGPSQTFTWATSGPLNDELKNNNASGKYV